MKDARIPGLALGIVHDGHLVHLRGFGRADDCGRAFTPQTPFFIGSNSKSFTALAVMQLAEAGKVDLDAPVQRYIPWFRVADPQASAQITVRHLLNQTSGLTERAGRGATLAAGMHPLGPAVRALPGTSPPTCMPRPPNRHPASAASAPADSWAASSGGGHPGSIYGRPGRQICFGP